MTKIKLLGGIVVMALMFTASTAHAATPEQVYAKSNAPIATEKAFSQAPVEPAKAKEKPNTPPCKNFLVVALWNAGFRGENLREAWAIAMRESGGREDAISSTGDYGVFQFNRAAHSSSDWWNTSKLLTREYNVKIAYRMSDGGRTWYPWDLDGHGNWKGNYTPYSTYVKYKSFYNKYPSKCK